MSKRNKISLIYALSLIIILACNINVQANTQDQNLALTITAQALLLQQTSQTSAPVEVAESQTPTNTTSVEATATVGGSGVINLPTSTFTITSTPTPSTITVTVSAETNCRTGPGLSFSSLYSLSVNQVAEVVGKNTITNYWIIKIPDNSGKTCWLWGKYATVSGDINSLVEFSTPTPLPIVIPVAPSTVSEQNTCTVNPDQSGFDYITSGTVTWQDNSNNETGFNVYWNAGFSGAIDNLIGTTGPNATSYGFSNQTYADLKNSVKVEAFNEAGTSKRVSVKVVLSCP